MSLGAFPIRSTSQLRIVLNARHHLADLAIRAVAYQRSQNPLPRTSENRADGRTPRKASLASYRSPPPRMRHPDSSRPRSSAARSIRSSPLTPPPPLRPGCPARGAALRSLLGKGTAAGPRRTLGTMRSYAQLFLRTIYTTEYGMFLANSALARDEQTSDDGAPTVASRAPRGRVGRPDRSARIRPSTQRGEALGANFRHMTRARALSRAR